MTSTIPSKYSLNITQSVILTILDKIQVPHTITTTSSYPASFSWQHLPTDILYICLYSLFSFVHFLPQERRLREGRGLCFPVSCFLFLFFKDFIYLFIIDIERKRERERGRDTGRGRSRLHASSPMRDSIPGLQDHTLGQRQALNH